MVKGVCFLPLKIRKALEIQGLLCWGAKLLHHYGSPCWVSEDKTTWLLFYRTVWHKVRVFKFKLCLNVENDIRLPPAPKVESAKLGRHTVRCAKRNTRNFCFGYFFSGSAEPPLFENDVIPDFSISSKVTV